MQIINKAKLKNIKKNPEKEGHVLYDTYLN